MNIQEFQHTIKYNAEFLTAFCIANDILNLDKAIQKAERHYNKCLTIRQKPIFKEQKSIQIKSKKRLTFKQIQSRKSISDKMQMTKQDMIEHIKNEITNNSYSWREFFADPTIYFDSQVMGKYYKNYIIRQSIIHYFKKEFVPF